MKGRSIVIRPNMEVGLHLLSTTIKSIRLENQEGIIVNTIASFYNWSVVRGANLWTLN
jgi:hypothetical protein